MIWQNRWFRLEIGRDDPVKLWFIPKLDTLTKFLEQHGLAPQLAADVTKLVKDWIAGL